MKTQNSMPVAPESIPQADLDADGLPAAGRLLRLIRLVETLNQREVPSCRELAGRLGVSVRTLYRDAQALRKAGYRVSLSPEAGHSNRTELASFPLPLSVRERYAVYLLHKKLRTLAHYGPNSDAVRGLEKLLASTPISDHD